jgi:hypothetical protein
MRKAAYPRAIPSAPTGIVFEMEALPSQDEASHPHPRVGASQWIPRLGFADRGLIPLIAASGIRMTARSLAQEGVNPQLGFLAREPYELGLVLEPETWRNQVPPPDRAPGFNALPYALRETALRPDHDRLAPDSIRNYAEAVVDEQAARGATLLLTPCHHVSEPDRSGRATDLELADAAAAYVQSEGLRAPAATDPHQVERELYAAIIVDVRALSEETSAFLLARYCALPVDGFWVRVSNLSHESSPACALEAATFLFALQAASNRPVVLAGGGHLHLGFLASGLAGASIGIAENERFSFPAPAPRPGPRSLVAYHPLLLRNYAINGPLISAAFQTHGCGCGHHDPEVPPSGREVKRHTLTLRLSDAHFFTSGAIDEREEHLRQRIEQARTAASWLGQPPIRVQTWLAVAAGTEGAADLAAEAG